MRACGEAVLFRLSRFTPTGAYMSLEQPPVLRERNDPARGRIGTYEANSAITCILGIADRRRYQHPPPEAPTIPPGCPPRGRRCESQLSSVSQADASRGSERSNGMLSSMLTTIRRRVCLRLGS